MDIFADGINRISLANNNLRITLQQNGPDNIALECGALIIPANQAAAFVNGLANGLKRLEEQIKAKKEETEVEVAVEAEES